MDEPSVITFKADQSDLYSASSARQQQLEASDWCEGQHLQRITMRHGG